MSKKEKQYFVVEPTLDGEPRLLTMTKKEILNDKYNEEGLIFEGNIIKGFNSKVDSGRLKDYE